MIKMTVANAMQSAQSLMEFSQNSIGMPIMVGLKLAANQRKLDAVKRQFEDRRNAMVEEQGKWNDQGGYTVDPDKLPALNKALAELASEEVELDLKQIHVSEIPASYNPNPNCLVALDWLIDETEKESGSRNRKKKR